MKLDDVGYAADLAAHLERTDRSISLVEGMIPSKDDVGSTYYFLDIWDGPEDDGSPRNDDGRPAVEVGTLLAALQASRALLVKELMALGVVEIDS